jgi:hypothetical protein
MTPLAAVIMQGIWLTGRKPALLSSSWKGQYRLINWRREIWPHQWQIALGWLSGYLLTQVYIPVLFKTQNAVVAGQMGLTLTASNVLGLIAQSWITRHVPAMATAVATHQWDEFNEIFARDLFFSCAAFLGGAATLCLVHLMLESTPYGERLLSFWPFVGVLAAGFLGHIQNSLAAQLRSFRREPLRWISVTGALLTAASALWGAFYYSASGVAIAMLTIQVVIVLPASILVWRRHKRNWMALVNRDASGIYNPPHLD